MKNNKKDGDGDDEHAHCVLGFIHSSPGAKVSASPYDLHTDTRKGVNFNQNNRFCAVSYDPYTELYIREFPRNGITFRGTRMVVRVE